MSSKNIFGQYYNNLGNNKTYTNVDYKCASGSDGESTLVFKDGEAQLIDNHGNVIGKIDLSKIASGPMTSWTSGSIILNPGEVKLIEGLEYGKLLKSVYFEVPPVYVTTLEDIWKYLVNVKFTILLNVGLDLREYDVSTTVSIEDKTSIEDRVQTLVNEIGAEDNIKVSIQEIEDEFGTQKVYLVFESLVYGYDFIITDLKFFNNRIIKKEADEYIEDNTPIGNRGEIEEAEDNIIFGDETSFEDANAFVDENGEVIANGNDVGHYDNNDDLANENSADHYYVGPDTEMYEGQTENQDQGDQEDSQDDNTSDGEIIPDDDYITIMSSSEFPVIRDKSLEIDAFKYPNGAARAWLIVPEWPESVDNNYVSLKLNHVMDHVVIPEIVEDIDCRGYYEMIDIDVYASERSEVERHNLKQFKYWMGENFTYMDSKNGSIIEVNHKKDFCTCPDLNLEIHNPHIGMYRYLDYVSMNNLWTNVGDFYGLVTNADTEDIDEKNLANSVFLYNRNEFPVKVSYFICV